jgi:amino acid adenylation domain-containing protein
LKNYCNTSTMSPEEGMNTENLEDLYDLSPLQQGILFHTLYTPDRGVYSRQSCFQITGELNQVALQQAWQYVLERHPVLRTAFYWEGLEKTYQVVYRRVPFPWQQHDWRGQSATNQQAQLNAFLNSDRVQPFDLTTPPLMRLSLIQFTDTSYEFIWSYHHVLLDGWSVPLILNEVLTTYHAFSHNQPVALPPVPPFKDYILWLHQQDPAQAETFWRSRLQGFTAPTPLLGNRLLPSRSTDEQATCDRQSLQLSEATTAQLRAFARQHQLTLNTIVQGGWSLLLGRYSNEADVVFGATVSGRPAALTEVESMVGLFINTLPVRVQLSSEAELLPWLKQLQTQQADLHQYEYSPLVQVQTWSDVPRGMPLFESILVFDNYPVNPNLRQGNSDLQIRQVDAYGRTHYPLTIVVDASANLTLEVIYDSDRFDHSCIARLLGHWQTLLHGMVEHPTSHLVDLPLLTPAEQQQFAQWNQTHTPFPPHSCLHQLIEAQTERTPTAIAVRYNGQSLSYHQLNQQSNQLAHHLLQRGVTPDTLIGVCLPRSLELLVALLAILKAGGAFLPLDFDYPPARLSLMLEDAQPPVILTTSSLQASLPDSAAQLVCLDSEWETIVQQPSHNPGIAVTAYQLAYLLYTSGTTGTPKGVMNIHQGICNRLLWMQQRYPLEQGDRVLQKTPYSFDVSVWECFWALLAGATVVLAQPGGHRQADYLVELIEQEQITTLYFVPSMLRQFMTQSGVEQCTSLKRVFCSGEVLPVEVQAQVFDRLPQVELHNLYGPTEAAIDVTAWQCRIQDDRATVPIGVPIANTQVYLLNAQMRPVPVGVVGEVYLGGINLARGYLKRPELTAERFVPNPFYQAGQEGESDRLYRTGDLARYDAEGVIEYVGRVDHQVKLRGCRIELGEIEAVLRRHPEVQAAVVVVHSVETGDERLVAYVIAESEMPPVPELMQFLKGYLPDYMIPAVIMPIDTLPLSLNGKLDYRALPQPDPVPLTHTRSFVAPVGATAQQLSQIWATILKVESISYNDNFFELGGHSLLATQVLSRINEAFQVKLPLRILFEHPTLADLTKQIDQARETDATPQDTAIPALPRSNYQMARSSLSSSTNSSSNPSFKNSLNLSP